MRISRKIAVAAVSGGLCLQGCLYTSHHFNTGRLLEPGEHHWEIGIGQQNFVDYGCSEAEAARADQALKAELVALGIPLGNQQSWGRSGTEIRKDDEGNPVCRADRYFVLDSNQREYTHATKNFPVTTATSHLISGSLAWRLGVRKAWGPLTGVDVGWRLEAPTGPASLELDTRLGLPLPERLPDWSHSISLGWGIGAWADNSWFGEYALSRGFGAYRPFANARLTYLATQPSDLGVRSTFNRFDAYRRWVGQGVLGCEIILPPLFLLPRRILPTVVMAYPAIPFTVEYVHAATNGIDVSLALGLSWGL